MDDIDELDDFDANVLSTYFEHDRGPPPAANQTPVDVFLSRALVPWTPKDASLEGFPTIGLSDPAESGAHRGRLRKFGSKLKICLNAEGIDSSDSEYEHLESQDDKDDRDDAKSDNVPSPYDFGSTIADRPIVLPAPGAPEKFDAVARQMQGAAYFVTLRANDLLEGMMRNATRLHALKASAFNLILQSALILQVWDRVFGGPYEAWTRRTTRAIHWTQFIAVLRYLEECSTFLEGLASKPVDETSSGPRQTVQILDSSSLSFLDMINRFNFQAAQEAAKETLGTWQYLRVAAYNMPGSRLSPNDIALISVLVRYGQDVPVKVLASSSQERQDFMRMLNTTDFESQLAQAEKLVGLRSSTRDVLQIVASGVSIGLSMLPAGGSIGGIVTTLVNMLGASLMDTSSKTVSALRLVERTSSIFWAVWKTFSEHDAKSAPITAERLNALLDELRGISTLMIAATQGGWWTRFRSRGKIKGQIGDATEDLKYLIEVFNLQSQISTSNWAEESARDRQRDEQNFDNIQKLVRSTKTILDSLQINHSQLNQLEAGQSGMRQEQEEIQAKLDQMMILLNQHSPPNLQSGGIDSYNNLESARPEEALVKRVQDLDDAYKSSPTGRISELSAGNWSDETLVGTLDSPGPYYKTPSVESLCPEERNDEEALPYYGA